MAAASLPAGCLPAGAEVPPPDGPRTAATPSPQHHAAVQRPSLAALYREHAPQVARWAARLGGPRLEVEDVLQEVFFIAHRQLEGFRGDCQLSTWLFSITRNVVRQRLQRERLRRFLLTALSLQRDAAPPPSPIQDVERRESQEIVYAALAGLPERYRTAFVLFELEGLSGQEASALTGVKVSTLRVWLMRARAQFLGRIRQIERRIEREGGGGG